MISRIYGWIVQFRAFGYARGIYKAQKLPCKVISVGNITVGGTGKTPMTIYLAGLLKTMDYKVAIISRGYKGGAERRGGMVGDGKMLRMSWDQAGDEPYLMALRLKDVPVLVGKNRYASGLWALERFKPDIVLLDDGFQHLKLARDMDLVLMDYQRPLGNHYLLPRGTLREPTSALGRADAVILTRSLTDAPDDLPAIPAVCRRKPVFRTRHIPYLHQRVGGIKMVPLETVPKSRGFDLAFLKGRPVYAFSGIANNKDFKATVENFSCRLAGFMEFSDHHAYTEQDLGHIRTEAQKAKADFLLTTDKDFVRIPSGVSWPVDLLVIGVKISFQAHEAVFLEFLKEKLNLSGAG